MPNVVTVGGSTAPKIAKIGIFSYKFAQKRYSPLSDDFLQNLATCHPYPLRGEKPVFGLLSKNNTGMAALRAGLPVMNQTILT